MASWPGPDFLILLKIWPKMTTKLKLYLLLLFTPFLAIGQSEPTQQTSADSSFKYPEVSYEIKGYSNLADTFYTIAALNAFLIEYPEIEIDSADRIELTNSFWVVSSLCMQCAIHCRHFAPCHRNACYYTTTLARWRKP